MFPQSSDRSISSSAKSTRDSGEAMPAGLSAGCFRPVTIYRRAGSIFNPPCNSAAIGVGKMSVRKHGRFVSDVEPGKGAARPLVRFGHQLLRFIEAAVADRDVWAALLDKIKRRTACSAKVARSDIGCPERRRFACGQFDYNRKSHRPAGTAAARPAVALDHVEDFSNPIADGAAQASALMNIVHRLNVPAWLRRTRTTPARLLRLSTA